MSDPLTSNNLTKAQALLLVTLRMVIGWHFLYEGISKLLIPNWTSAGYLENSRWLFSDLFHWIAANDTAIVVADWMNIIGLTLIGLALMVGLLTRLACVMGIVLLGLYYMANPPFISTTVDIATEGHTLFINRNIIEMTALLVLAVFPTDRFLGLERLIWLRQEAKFQDVTPEATPSLPQKSFSLNRREILKNLASIPILGTLVYGIAKKYRWEAMNAITGATIKVSSSTLKDIKGMLPRGRIKGKEISRVIMGGNLIGGWAHSRDLIYVSSLFKAYNTERKIFSTLKLAEQAGVNTINITGSQFPVINKYKRIYGSTLQTICQVHPTKDNLLGDINAAIDNGVDLIQIQGNCCDFRVRDGEVNVLAKAIDYIREQGYPAGLGAHSIQALIATDKAGIDPDFYMKTLHHDQYWSAHPRENRIPFSVDGDKSQNHDEFHDNMFCLFPDASIEFMENKNTPWIAFKVLAGGAIHPSEGFQFAFANGADFICVGMFDWQIVDDVNIALDILPAVQQRKRKWMA